MDANKLGSIWSNLSICLWKQSPLSPLFDTVWDQLVQAWIDIDIFDTQHSYRLASQSETFTNQIFERLFKILTEEKFRIHQHKCIQNWNSKQNELIDNDEDDEEENEKEAEYSNTDRKLYLSNSYSKWDRYSLPR